MRSLRDGDPELASLVAAGWVPTAESFGARLVLPDDFASLLRERNRLRALVDDLLDARELSVTPDVLRRWAMLELDQSRLPEVVRFDEETRGDYPTDSPATSRAVRDAHTAPELWDAGRVYGVIDPTDDRLVAVTVIRDIDEGIVETEFTAVSSSVRRIGLGAAIKAFSVLAEAERGVRVFRTGGSCANRAIRAVNTAVCNRETERWITLAAPSAP